MLMPSELRARRDLMRKVLFRLLTQEKWTRNGLFASTSAQASKFTWQRQALNKLVEEGYISREGTVKAPEYSVADVAAVQKLAADQKAIDRLLQESAKKKTREQDDDSDDGGFDSFDENADGNSDPSANAAIEAAPANPGDPTDPGKLMEHVLQLVYMTAQAVGDVRERLQRIEDQLGVLNKRALVLQNSAPTHPVPSPPPLRPRALSLVPRDDHGSYGGQREGQVVQAQAHNVMPHSDTSSDTSPLVRPAKLTEAVAFLMSTLGEGPLSATTVVRLASAESISPPSLQQACKDIGVVVTRNAVQGHSEWSLP